MTVHQYMAIAGYLWLAWAAYWFYSSRKVKAEVYRQSTAQRLIHRGQICLAFLLLFGDKIYVGAFAFQLWPQNNVTGVIGLLITAKGIIFMICARRHLAGNWSAAVTIKKEHELIMTGPYSITRHPIYTGFISAAFGTAIILGETRGLLAVIILIYAFSAKLVLEETILTKQFPMAYPEYAKRVKKIIPFLF